MANRYPLIVSATSNKIEELGLSDNLNLTQNNIVANGAAGTNGQYLKSDGTKVVWDFPGDVYLTATQTITNKTFTSCTISGSTNTLSNIANSSLVNSSITINGSAIPLGGSVTTPDTNTTYNYASLVTQSTPTTRIALRLSGNDSTTDEIVLEAGNNTTLTRTLLSESGGNHSSLIRIDSSDTTLTYSAGNGLQLNGTSFSIKDNNLLADYFLTKWDNINKKFVSSVISQSPITNDIIIGGSSQLICSSAITGVILNSSFGTLNLRTGPGLFNGDANIKVTKTSDISGNTVSYSSLQWYSAGSSGAGYWRIDDSSNPLPEGSDWRLVTTNETQTLSNKTLNGGTLKSPIFNSTGPGLAAPTTDNFTVTNQLVATQGTATINKLVKPSSGTFATVIPVTSGIATFDLSQATEFLGTLAGVINTWQFTNVDSTANTAQQVRIYLQGGAGQGTNAYGDNVNIVVTGGTPPGTTVPGGIRWVGGTAPSATANIDFINFMIITTGPATYTVLATTNLNMS